VELKDFNKFGLNKSYNESDSDNEDRGGFGLKKYAAPLLGDHSDDSRLEEHKRELVDFTVGHHRTPGVSSDQP
jgi:hypothetical protein